MSASEHESPSRDPLDHFLTGVQHRGAGDRWCCAAKTLDERRQFAAAGFTCDGGRCAEVDYLQALLNQPSAPEPDEPTR